MHEINFKKSVSGQFDQVINQVTEALKKEGFGVLTRIDLDSKIKEKLGKEINPVAILGACNPQLAYEAYNQNSDVASLLPCNAVIRKIGDDKVSVELAKPSALMEMLDDESLVAQAKEADEKLRKVINSL